MPNRSALRLDGPNPLDRAAFSGFAFPVAVVGKNGAVISPGAGKGLFVTAGSTVRVRALTVTGAPGSLGVQADAGAELHMDRCLIQNNPLGGILINGAGYDIQNTIVAGNGGTTGFGFRVRSPLTLATFRFNTVVGNPVAVECDQNMMGNIDSSIVVGPIVNCSPNGLVTAEPAFQSTRPYHLSMSIGCPGGNPSSFPAYDFDGDPRSSPVDCGADQLVP
jgi:hypothetical protein